MQMSYEVIARNPYTQRTVLVRYVSKGGFKGLLKAVSGEYEAISEAIGAERGWHREGARLVSPDGCVIQFTWRTEDRALAEGAYPSFYTFLARTPLHYHVAWIDPDTQQPRSTDCCTFAEAAAYRGARIYRREPTGSLTPLTGGEEF